MIAIFILIGFIVLLALWGIGIYNSFVSMRNTVEEGFATIDVYLKKRYDLIPNLVNTVKGYTKYEGDTLERVISARNRYLTAGSTSEKIENENMMTGALSKLFALTESYPDLKADTNFINLQNQITKIEEELVQARKYYNGTVKNFNTKVETFPNNMIANFMNLKKYPYFEIKNEVERETVNVQF
ncbi:MAG: LemA family protein [Fusobacteriaceae bacterium]